MEQMAKEGRCIRRSTQRVIEPCPTPPTDHERLGAFARRGVDTLIIGAADTNAEFRSKRFALDLFRREEVEVAFSDYLFACDWVDELMSPAAAYEGYFPTVSTGLPDIFVRPDWATLRILPWEPISAIVIGDYYSHDGEEMAISPRTVASQVVERSGASAMSRWPAASTSSWSSSRARQGPQEPQRP